MGQFNDLTGARFGMLIVMFRAPDHIQPSGQHKRVWHCKCDCGNECDVRATDLKSGNTKSCGCLQKDSRGKSSFEDLTGLKYGKLTVLYRLPNHITPSGQTKRLWHCKCDCGNECDVYASQLKSGKISCGCLLEEKKQINAIKRANIKKEKSLINKQETIKRRIARKEEYLKENSLAVLFPQMLNEWNYEKNTNLNPSSITAYSPIKVWWLGKCGHEWEATVGSRVKGNRCPYCSNQKVLEGFNDLATTNHELLIEWDFERNDIRPTEVTSGSNNVVWWKCNLGHSYEMKINSRTGKQKCGCPYCSNPPKKILKGFNDFESKYPEIAAEWHPIKNDKLKPSEVFSGSAKQVWWLGKCGHEYLQSIVRRVNGANCPYCSHQRLLVGYDDLATTNPELLKEWDFEKNSFKPTEISIGVHKKVWWKCPFGHSYQAYPSNRGGIQHCGCPICDKENHTSFPEQAVYYYIKKYFVDAENSNRNAIGMELDIYIPSKNIAIEYDGYTWHKNNEYELKKNLACKNKNVRLIRIREEGLTEYNDCVCVFRKEIRKNESLNLAIVEVLNLIDKNFNFDVDVDRDSSLIYSSYIVTRKSHSLESVYPDIAREWHPTKNGDLKPNMVAPMTNKKVWWLGKCGHEWIMPVQNRTNQKCDCPYCSGKKVLEGYNDLQTKYPILCDEWDYKKNMELNLYPNKVSSHSDKKAWWICSKCGYEWFSKIDGRTRMNAGCPKCAISNASVSKYKKVVCLDTGDRYESIKDASRATGISAATISSCCRGKIKKAGGYRWDFVRDKNNE